GWHHTAVTIDSVSMTIRLYLDGELIASGVTTVLPKDLGTTTQNWLGRSQYTADAYFLGSLDDFRIYNRVLSDAELRYLAGDR
ncbi:MAG: LamG domain-containing protein, partial [Phycisphaerales bacterium]